jgi:integrase
MAVIKLDYVSSFIDSRGKLRHVFRRKGHKRVTIKGRPGSPEFMDRYHALLDQTGGPLPVADIGAARTKPGTIDALIVKYLQHDVFTKGLARATQATRRPILDGFREFKTPSGRRYGANRLATMIRQDVVAVLAGRPPTSQKGWLKTLRHWIAFAIDQGDCKNDPTVGIKTTKPVKSSGYLTWGDAEIEQYRERHKIGTMARLALELMLNIAARRHDAHLIGRQHLRDGCLSWRPSKTSQSTGKLLTIPVMPELQAALDAMPSTDALTFLLTEYGRPFKSAAAFGGKFADWCKAAGLKPVLCDDGKVRSYRAHGLRKAACMQLAHAGCTAPEIMAISGHATLSEAQKYIVAVEQARMAETAMAKRAAGTRQAQAVPNISRSKHLLLPLLLPKARFHDVAAAYAYALSH